MVHLRARFTSRGRDYLGMRDRGACKLFIFKFLIKKKNGNCN